VQPPQPQPKRFPRHEPGAGAPVPARLPMTYLFASILLGLGIAVDVALATIAMARHLRDPQKRSFWIRNVTLAHVLLPMIGYYGFTVLALTFSQIRLPLGILATALILWFLLDQLRGWLRESEAATAEEVRLAAVLAVSWDALWSGPAKSAQAIGWTPVQILFSFFIAGAVVAAVAAASAALAPALLARLHAPGEVAKLARREVLAMWVEFSVIGFFGVLSLARYVLQAPVPASMLLAGSFALSGLIFVALRKRLFAQRLRQLEILEAETR
jgi:hypothetical protein